MDTALLSSAMLALDGLAVLYSLAILRRAAVSRRTSYAIAAVSIGWMAVLHAVLMTKSIFAPDIPGVAFLLVVFGFVGLVGGLLLLPPVRAVLTRVSQSDLLQLQGVRVFFGAGFLVLVAVGDLPFTFGVIDGFTHITAGFLGLIAAQRRAEVGSTRWLWIANIFGLLDILIVASTISLVLLPDITPHHRMMYAVFFPAPLWFWFHVISMVKAARGS